VIVQDYQTEARSHRDKLLQVRASACCDAQHAEAPSGARSGSAPQRLRRVRAATARGTPALVAP
jgi:hypothetical protein